MRPRFTTAPYQATTCRPWSPRTVALALNGPTMRARAAQSRRLPPLKPPNRFARPKLINSALKPNAAINCLSRRSKLPTRTIRTAKTKFTKFQTTSTVDEDSPSPRDARTVARMGVLKCPRRSGEWRWREIGRRRSRRCRKAGSPQDHPLCRSRRCWMARRPFMWYEKGL